MTKSIFKVSLSLFASLICAACGNEDKTSTISGDVSANYNSSVSSTTTDIDSNESEADSSSASSEKNSTQTAESNDTQPMEWIRYRDEVEKEPQRFIGKRFIITDARIGFYETEGSWEERRATSNYKPEKATFLAKYELDYYLTDTVALTFSINQFSELAEVLKDNNSRSPGKYIKGVDITFDFTGKESKRPSKYAGQLVRLDVR